MTNDENTALLDTLSDKFDKNDDLESSMVKAIENASNPDHIVKSAAANPLAFNMHSTSEQQTANVQQVFFCPVDTSLRRVSIEGVVTSSGDVSTNPHENLLPFTEHWGSKMGNANSPTCITPPPDDGKQLLDSVLRFVTDSDLEILDAELTTADLACAIGHMKATSSPGMDGLTAGFYQVAPDVFDECFVVIFNDRLRRGKLLVSQHKSAVVLIHKKGLRTEPGNYRPIALVAVDFKMLSKALTYRLQNVIVNLIHPDPKGFVNGRSIHHHVRFLADLQDLVTNQDKEAYAMFLAFQKSFDRVNWAYIFRLLVRMGFGKKFVTYIQLLYTKPKATYLSTAISSRPYIPHAA
ncbi:FOG: Reverse transcriptase [Plasmopara halstedii]|uniref:FOG: Reverse transcriptase n=1 Tax=Plasmopara halstedii TaxID=4781 RepID=A0A0P1AYQ9_PLAHL|nr:FOG: Reverse transcriptase [Plasmopara halstedii]CEG46404.1 FOG: Reverse transcriptase [Plasmopara halstedii]|eukprot:XP_024582773.1 FOG: Reverse transcriptase [Plasmopara halstedii]